MRIAVISDIHGNLLALDAVLADIAREGADVTVNLGDILSGPLEPARTADRLMALDLPTISGNHERQVLTDPEDRTNRTDAFTRSVLEERHFDMDGRLAAYLAAERRGFPLPRNPGERFKMLSRSHYAGGPSPLGCGDDQEARG